MDLKLKLDRLYETYNKIEYVDPDPLLFLYDYPEMKDREIAGMIAASFAYGQVAQIMKTVAHVLEKMGPSPFAYIDTRSQKEISHDFKGFVYRFAKQSHIVSLLWEIHRIIERFGSLEASFCEGLIKKEGANALDGLVNMYRQIEHPEKIGHLLADPEKNSACKRSHLFLRWMVRKDAVDPGGWEQVSPESLMIPLDTHMYKIGVMSGFTQRKNMDRKTVEQITNGFKNIIRQDPVKYDFCLTRFGIRKSLDINQLKTVFLNG